MVMIGNGNGNGKINNDFMQLGAEWLNVSDMFSR